VPDGWFDFLRFTAPDLGFDGVERGDALNRFACDGRGMRDVDLVELASCVRPACVRISLGNGEVM
jgi:hypothetical protein